MMATRILHLRVLLFFCLGSFWPQLKAQHFYTIDSVSLVVTPRGEVASGTNVTLRCEATVSQQDASLQLAHHFLFLRDDVQVHAVQAGGGVALYQLSPAHAAHSGTYECSVTVQDKSKRSSAHRLTVRGLQTPMLWLSSTDLYAGEEVNASCSAAPEVGPLVFSFYLDQDLAKTVQSAGAMVTTRLELKHAGNWKLYCSYVVTTVPGAGVSNHSNTVSVMVKALTILPIMSVVPSPAVLEGDKLQVHCRVVDPPRKAATVVFLTKDSHILKTSQTSRLVHNISSVEPKDSGEYECKAEMGNVQKKTSMRVTVKEMFSRPELFVAPSDVFVGERFSVSCRVAHLVPERLSRNDLYYVLYISGDRLAATSGNYSATAHPNTNGNYSCQAYARSQGRVFNKPSASLIVRAKVPVSTPVLSVVGGRLVLGQPFQLQCQSAQGSLPVSYTLRVPGRPVEERLVAGEGERALFNVSSVGSSADLGRFICHAQNNRRTAPRESNAGILEQTATIIEPVSRPELVLFPDLGDVAEGQDLVLVCSVQRGTPPVTFSWYHTQSSDLLAFKTNEQSAAHTIRGLRQEHRGGYYCVAINEAGDSKRSATIIVGVRMAGWKKGLIAAFCILLLFLLLLVFLAKKGLHPLKRKSRTTELSVKPAGTRTDREEGVTLKLVNEAANVTPGVMGRSVWSEHVSGSESEDAAGEELRSFPRPALEPPETQYTEVQPPQVDPNRAPVKPGTETVYSEVRNSVQGAMETADGGSVEYAQLNHDDGRDRDNCVNHHSDHVNHNDHANHNGCSDNGDYGDHGDHDDCAE